MQTATWPSVTGVHRPRCLPSQRGMPSGAHCAGMMGRMAPGSPTSHSFTESLGGGGRRGQVWPPEPCDACGSSGSQDLRFHTGPFPSPTSRGQDGGGQREAGPTPHLSCGSGRGSSAWRGAQPRTRRPRQTEMSRPPHQLEGGGWGADSSHPPPGNLPPPTHPPTRCSLPRLSPSWGGVMPTSPPPTPWFFPQTSNWGPRGRVQGEYEGQRG